MDSRLVFVSNFYVCYFFLSSLYNFLCSFPMFQANEINLNCLLYKNNRFIFLANSVSYIETHWFSSLHQRSVQFSSREQKKEKNKLGYANVSFTIIIKNMVNFIKRMQKLWRSQKKGSFLFMNSYHFSWYALLILLLFHLIRTTV